MSGHKGRIKDLPRRDRDLILAWIDTNGLYHGTWDRSPHGSKVAAWAATRCKGSYYGALYRRLKPRRGPKRAIVAVAHAIRG